MSKLGDKQATFKQFPEFSKLQYGDKAAYEALIKDFPPLYDTSFTALMTWWNPLGDMSVSQLNGNLVVPYWLPGDAKHSGLSLIGTNKVDESFCTMLDYLKAQGRPAKLINVPDFVINHVQYPELFIFKEERKYDEYIIPIERFYPLKNMPAHRRRKVEKLLNSIDEKRIRLRMLDLRDAKNRKILLDAALKWQAKSINNYGKLEMEAVRDTLEHATELEVDNICLFVDDNLYGFCLFEMPQDKRYVGLRHIKATHNSMLRFELIGYMFAKYFAERGFTYVDVGADFSILPLRMFMLTLGASHFFRKYTVEATK
ncbi:MAG TPA: phosphatidylglycerol lysyltransferase domain-containing protein [Candidatus Saccharimonadales bacterium]|nr:phosphatidylglycerol lysyltransferase domain-containing protein [Candidatus Saccharimonadales bacterium]